MKKTICEVIPLLLINNARNNDFINKIFCIYCLFNKYSYICAVILLIKLYILK